jgi:hypothetical protein
VLFQNLFGGVVSAATSVRVTARLKFAQFVRRKRNASNALPDVEKRVKPDLLLRAVKTALFLFGFHLLVDLRTI